jgi:hypothetical protein
MAKPTINHSPAAEEFAQLVNASQWSLPQADKEVLLVRGLNDLSRFHYDNCVSYRRIIDGYWAKRDAQNLANIPFLPVSLFKTHWLSSRAKEELRMVMTSSGTTGAAVSQIAIDVETAKRQSRALNASILSVLPGPRRPMLIADTRNVIKDPKLLSARGAGVLGLMRFGKSHSFLLDENLGLDTATLHEFLSEHDGQKIFMFGFTFMVWKYFYQALKEGQYDLSGCTLIHSGGWKKLQSEAVSPEEFRKYLYDKCGMESIYNFYGMVEQMGSIFLEGEDGLLYPPNFSDVIIRDPFTLQPVCDGEVGVVQVLSLLPGSYPGHSILTEDLGVIEHVDEGIGGRMGKAIRITGRVPKVELRGCSDIFAKTAA